MPARREAARRRARRRLGRELRLFATDPLAGAGLPLWLPDGAVIRAELERLAAEEAIRGGCQRVYTPVLAKRALFERSGHWAKFADDMFPPMRVGYEKASGEAAFYGPKIDVQVTEPAGREETLSTVQLDFNQPERFGLRFMGSDGAGHRPVMIHRGVLSAMERLVAHLIEQYNGAFPVWLAPVQLLVLPVAGPNAGQARALADQARAAGLRAECDPADGTLGARIRRAHDRRIPVAAVVGDREAAGGLAALRLRDGRRLDGVPAARLIAELSRLAAERAAGLGFR
jgi:threonyl-tRNA synthetase